ncbi:septal ring lytic transglycosylase RlpA family protein [Polyangium jinanense]|uniref:Probable endolytic peptidoglycan transglycosylase RlpA n=1 Tax=Polyangium jinanense TaxID=2829994 RepID=A0A9X3X7A2_9BACT|nr:septal ring lytic transglycosylase RlpA family protein [Polyangium jinanense]MDC3957955.1 septal ring lytic transglycosylase RlpA family protein [Polyangium jinanense]MDC3983508.1 septal ring lytic transglycosylase RlpA family protein [Polyangium jinanense]
MLVRRLFPGLALAALLGLSTGCGGGAETAGRGAVTPDAASAGGAGAGREERGKASYYADKLKGRPTASGEPYEPTELTAAHKTLPFGAIVRVEREGRSVEVRINDRGPHVRGRIIDLSRRAAEALGIVRMGVADVVLRVVSMPPPKTAAKKKKRR